MISHIPFGVELSRERTFLLFRSRGACTCANVLLLQWALNGGHRSVRNPEIIKSAFEFVLASHACSFSSKGGLPVIFPFGN